MKLSVIKEDKNTIEFYVEGERHTIPAYLKDKISEIEDVEFCAYKLDHPLDKRARIIVKTKSKSPKKVIADAVEKANEEIKDFKKAFDKAVKK